MWRDADPELKAAIPHSSTNMANSPSVGPRPTFHFAKLLLIRSVSGLSGTVGSYKVCHWYLYNTVSGLRVVVDQG